MITEQRKNINRNEEKLLKTVVNEEFSPDAVDSDSSEQVSVFLNNI